MFPDTFIVADVFKHNDILSKTSQWFNYPFDTWMLGFFGKQVPVLKESSGLQSFTLPETMNDEQLVSSINTDKPSSISEVLYLQLRYALIIEPALGEQLFGYRLLKDETNYLFRVTGDKGDFITNLCYDSERSQWDSSMHPFSTGASRAGSIFLYF